MTTQKSYYGPDGAVTIVLAIPAGWALLPGFNYVDPEVDPEASFLPQYPSLAALLAAMNQAGAIGTDNVLLFDPTSASAGHYLVGEIIDGPAFASVDTEAKSLVSSLSYAYQRPTSAFTWSRITLSAGTGFKLSYTFTGGQESGIGAWPAPHGATIHEVLYEINTSSDTSWRLTFQFDDATWQIYGPGLGQIAGSLRILTAGN